MPAGVRASPFVGQGNRETSSSTSSSWSAPMSGGKNDGLAPGHFADVSVTGISQAEQARILEQFREGVLNVLVATCVAEEGLDIGLVDLVVSYDSSGSPIRMVQRMGRTGRKRNGRVVMLVNGSE